MNPDPQGDRVFYLLQIGFKGVKENEKSISRIK